MGRNYRTIPEQALPASQSKDSTGNYTITNLAGHTTKLFLQRTYTGKLLTFAKLTGIQYGSASVITLPTTSFLYVWDPRGTPPGLLSQTIAVNGTFVIEAFYNKQSNKTTVLVLSKGVPTQKQDYPGLEIPRITTKGGVVSYQP